MVTRGAAYWRAQFTWRKDLFYLLFHGFHVALFIIGWWKQSADERLAALNELNFSVWISRGAGLALSVDVMLILLPMCRNLLRIIRPTVKWLPLDESQWFHRQVAYSLVFWTVIHVAAHYVKSVYICLQGRASTLTQTASSTSSGIN